MKQHETTTTAADGKELHTRQWLPDDSPHATLLVVHGMGEHSARYADFAEFLTELNIAVFAYDHRGHGFTDLSDKGIIPSDDAYHQMVDDLGVIRNQIYSEFPDLPQVLFAHSMGSFLTMRHLQLSSEKPAPSGVIYSGSSGAVSPLLPLGIMFSSALKAIAGDSHRSELLRDIIFKPYNNAFEPTRTRHDWISSDPDAVDRYVSDPNSGFTPSVSFLNHFFKGLQATQRHDPFSGPHSYPVLIIAGSDDPLSKPLNGITELENKFINSGLESVEKRVYEGGRHEMLSETNKDEVMQDIAGWISRTIESVKASHYLS